MTPASVVIAIVLFVAAYAFRYIISHELPWKDIISGVVPAVWTACLFGIYCIIRAVHSLRRDDIGEWENWRPAIIGGLKPPRPSSVGLVMSAGSVIAFFCVVICITWFLPQPSANGRSANSQTVVPVVPVNPAPPDLSASRIAEEVAKRLPVSATPERVAAKPTPPQPKAITLVFANSPLFTENTKEEIRRDLSGFMDYLTRLRLEAPLVVPPISVGSPGTFTKQLELTGPAGAESKALFLLSGGRYEYRTYPNQKQSTDFGQNIVLLAPELSDRTAVTALYGMYALSQFLNRTEPDPDDFYWQARDLAVTTGAVYLSSSFWNQKARFYYLYNPLWEIRGRLGQKVTDQLMAYALRAFNESVYRSHKVDLGAYFYARLKDAADIIDNDGSITKTVAEVWNKYNLPTAGPFVPSR